MRVREAAWAALVPWSGVQDRPTWLLGADGIPMSAVIGLQEALNDIQAGDSVLTVKWTNITGKPNFGSASFSSAGDFATAAQGSLASTALQPGDPVSLLDNDAEYLSAIQSDVFQSGIEPIVMGQTLYPVAFSLTMTAKPEVDLQYYLTDGTSEVHYAGVRDDMTDQNGFAFQLDSAPLISSGSIHWKARVYP